MPEGHFDHCPIAIMVYPTVVIGKHLFKYFKMWSNAPNFIEVVSDSWNMIVHGTLMYIVVQKLKNTKHALKKMNAEGYSEIQSKDIMAYKKMIECQEELQKYPHDEVIKNEEFEVVMNCRNYLEFLAYKAKLNWCRDGDENTSLFHQSIKARLLKNTVYAINDMNDHWQDNLQDVNEAFLAYYEQLLGSPLGNRTRVKMMVIEKGTVLSMDHIQLLERPYIAQEVKIALFSIPRDKSLCLDGCGTHFFHEAWSVIGEEVTQAILNVVHSCKLHTELNYTILTLIPKVSCPSSISEFRHIAYCNTLYKCITKMLCNRLSIILPEIIDENQGAFIKERFIATHMVCQDLVRHYGRKNVKPSCLVKRSI